MTEQVVKRMLVVDDEPNVTMVVADSLRKLGKEYEIETAHNGAEALEKIRQTAYTLVITDYKMPGMDGLDLAEAIRELSPQTLVVLMTAFNIHGVQEKLDQQALDGYIQKPFTVAQIRSIVEQMAGGEVAKEVEAEAASAIKSSPLGTRRILIMDDDDGLRHLYSKALSYAGFTVHAAATIDAAQHLLESFRFDVFLADIRMGHEGGMELLRDKRETFSQQGTQIVMVSGEPHYRQYCQELGADFFMTKPISLESLMALLGRLTSIPTTT
ncbi:MAG: response regulator [Ardenticatenales bacterium]|nr:response regulator [Ardenticatenales bacterium]